MLEQTGSGGEGVDLSAQSRFSYAIARTGVNVVVAVRGQVDRSGVDGLARVLRDLIDNQGNGAVVVDLRDVAAVDPSAAKLFSAASAWAHRHGGRFGVHHPPASLARCARR